MDFCELMRGELLLTVDIIAGLVVAEVIMRLHIPDRIMRHIPLRRVPPVTALAVALSAASSKAGAAVLSGALSRGEITESVATWSVLMLPLPSYLRRWPSTFALSVSMAGVAGGIFAFSLLVRSVLRFTLAFVMLRREGVVALASPACGDGVAGVLASPAKRTCLVEAEGSTKYAMGSAWRKLLRTLPVAWAMFAVSYGLVPIADGYFRDFFAGGLLPVSGWAVAAASLGHVSGALSLAGGAISSGELGTVQAFFALVLGSGLGTVTRVLRQNAGYYYGLFPRPTATKMLVMNLATILPLVMMNLLFAGLALSLWA